MRRFALFTLLMLLIIAPATTYFGQTPRGEDYYRSSGLWRNDILTVASTEIKEKRYSEAIRQINRVLAADPGDTDALLMRASAYYELKRYDLALADVNASLTGKYAHLTKAEALHIRASIHLARNNKQQALADLKAAIKHKMDYVPAYQFLMQKFSPSEVISVISETSGDSVGQRERWIPLLFLAFAYEKKGEPMIAVVRSVSALRIKDDIPEAHALLYKYLDKDPQRYINELTSIIDAHLTSKSLLARLPSTSLWYRSNLYSRTGKADLALADVDMLLKNYPLAIKTEQHARYIGLRAHLLASMNKIDPALTEINRVIQSGFVLTNAYELRARVFCQMGRKSEAKADEKKVVSHGGKLFKPCS